MKGLDGLPIFTRLTLQDLGQLRPECIGRFRGPPIALANFVEM
ncbi:hypothetical protein V474_12950 [Novosphingobium barchaimii LL02]|uniref:Uncharacterized protein n=1 Tax=Novosphingobium barchaimii LL02 TaxID=1114963 RepID=A0A0J7Y4X7_9SPHN|nr:hypothetical protein V474_12950 [Novosphingobium barchaimii LL02]